MAVAEKGRAARMSLTLPLAPEAYSKRWTDELVHLLQLNLGTEGSGAWVSWTPAYTGSGGMGVTLVTLTDAQYLRQGSIVFFKLYVFLNFSAPLSNQFNVSFPVAVIGQPQVIHCWGQVVPDQWVSYFAAATPPGSAEVVNNGGVAFNSGSQSFILSGNYRCA